MYFLNWVYGQTMEELDDNWSFGDVGWRTKWKKDYDNLGLCRLVRIPKGNTLNILLFFHRMETLIQLNSRRWITERNSAGVTEKNKMVFVIEGNDSSDSVYGQIQKLHMMITHWLEEEISFLLRLVYWHACASLCLDLHGHVDNAYVPGRHGTGQRQCWLQEGDFSSQERQWQCHLCSTMYLNILLDFSIPLSKLMPLKLISCSRAM